MKIGDRVKWSAPMNTDEAAERFILVEMNGDRCLIQYVCDLPFPPVQVAKTSDLVLA